MLRCFLLALCCTLFLPAGSGRAEEGSFDSDGVKINYFIEGKGEPVLLIHGFAINARLQWDAPGIVKALVRDHRVIALDVRGHGKSDKPCDPDKYGTLMVEDAVRLLDHLKIDKVHIVGYSMGAMIAGKLMTTYPDRLLSATLAGSCPHPEGSKLPDYVDKLADSLDEGKGMGPLIAALTPPGKSQLPASVIQILNSSLVGDNSKALAAVVRSWKKLNVTKEQLKANKVPALALIGADDPLKSTVDLIKDDMANLKVVEIEGTNHYTAYFSPKFVYHLRNFLNEHKSFQSKPRRGGKSVTSSFPRSAWERTSGRSAVRLCRGPDIPASGTTGQHGADGSFPRRGSRRSAFAASEYCAYPRRRRARGLSLSVAGIHGQQALALQEQSLSHKPDHPDLTETEIRRGIANSLIREIRPRAGSISRRRGRIWSWRFPSRIRRTIT
jgi:pimeloyl-ACP methyl ester carboxylesterase